MADKVVQLVDKNSNNLYPVAGSAITNAISTGAISNQAVTNAKIADGAVTTAKIADLNVTTGKIANGAVTGVANNATSIGDAKLALNTVGTPNLRNQAVTSDKIDWTTIDYSQERIVGTWIDGKVLYEKILKLDFPTLVVGSNSKSTGLSNITIVWSEAIMNSGTSVYPLTYVAWAGIRDDIGYVFRSNGSVIDVNRRETAITLDNITIYINIRYTKN